MKRISSFDELCIAATELIEAGNRPTIVGVSGFGGSGKTVLASELAVHFTPCATASIDDFQSPMSYERSTDWSGFERLRILDEVMRPFRASDARLLVVEGVGIFHPELAGEFDLKVWIDVGLETATERGMWRDEHVNESPQVWHWRNVWVPNDRDFFERYRPDEVADINYSPRVYR